MIGLRREGHVFAFRAFVERAASRGVALLCVLGASSGAGCVSRLPAPTTPFGHPIAPMAARATGPVVVPSLAGRTLVIGPVDSEVTQPIGGAYDHQDYEGSPLERAWFVPAIGVLLGDALVRAARHAGAAAFRETSGVLLAAGRSSVLRREGSEQWRVRLVQLEHDLVRGPDARPPRMELAARVLVQVIPGGEISGTSAPVLERAIDLHLELPPQSDGLAALADALVAEIARR